MMRKLALVTNSLPVDNLSAYIYRVNSIPLLTEQEELDLATRHRDHDDLDAAKRMIMAHLRFVVKVAKKYSGYGLSQADLIQEGNIGLMKAVKRFDPAHGVRLVSFAIHWIKAEIHEFVLRNWRIVKIATTKAQRKLFFNLRSLKKQISWLKQQDIKDIAKELCVKEKTIVEMEARLHSQDESFDAYDDDSDDNSFSPAQYLADPTSNPELLLTASDTEMTNHHQLQKALITLDERSRSILQRRWLDTTKATLQELAAEYNVSAERIRQLERQAMDKIKMQLEQH